MSEANKLVEKEKIKAVEAGDRDPPVAFFERSK